MCSSDLENENENDNENEYENDYDHSHNRDKDNESCNESESENETVSYNDWTPSDLTIISVFCSSYISNLFDTVCISM